MMGKWGKWELGRLQIASCRKKFGCRGEVCTEGGAILGF